MDLNQFKTWALNQVSVGKYNDGQFVGQCVSLINQYCYRVLGVPAGSWGDAKDWPSNQYVAQYFDTVRSPQRGDVGVMGSNYGNGYGHIFIYLSPTELLEQNGRIPLKISTGTTYPNPIAILRHKGEVMEAIITKEDVYNLRIINSEIAGWDFNKVHQGDYDAQELKAWMGQTFNKCIQEKWAGAEAFRAKRNADMSNAQYVPVTDQLFKKK